MHQGLVTTIDYNHFINECGALILPHHMDMLLHNQLCTLGGGTHTLDPAATVHGTSHEYRKD